LGQRLGGGRDQWDDSLKALSKLGSICDSEEYEDFASLAKPFATLGVILKNTKYIKI
jgi:hypothetical protein